MALHLLPCPKCETPIEVAARHAGQIHQCQACRTSVEIPTLGKLKQLPLVDAGQPTRAAGKPGRLSSWLFAGGLMIAALMGVGGFALHTYAKSLYSDVGQFKQDFELVTTDSIDARKDYEVFDLWTSMNETVLGEWKEHPGIGYNVQSKILSNIAFGMFGACGLGMLLIVASFMLGRQVD